MAEWMAGYVADIDYTHGYYPELNPLRHRLALLNVGVAVPKLESACELGFGQGVSINVHAAAGAIPWYGTDFNPTQVAFAQELARASGASATLYDDAFADFAHRAELPDFDFIGLHGIWSWISTENRMNIADFVRRKLKVGGVLYISYNTLPGWAGFAPIRHLMQLHAERMGAPGSGFVSRINGAIDFADRLLVTNPAFARVNPQLADRMKRIKSQNRNYLAHEYFNRDWQPMYFAEMAASLEQAKLSFACSSHYFDHVDALNLTEAQQGLLREAREPMWRESMRDFMVNQQFRRDYWVKGLRRLSPERRNAELKSLRVMLVSHRPGVSLKVKGALGEASLTESVYGPLLDVLADHETRTIGELATQLAPRKLTFSQLIQACMILTGAGHMRTVQDDATISLARASTVKLNTHLLDLARENGNISYLASPVTGGGVELAQIHQLFLRAFKAGESNPSAWAASAWSHLVGQGRKLIKDNVPLQSSDENLAELQQRAQRFATEELPILRALQVA